MTSPREPVTPTIAYEPTASLDRERGRQVMGLFRTAAEERGAAVLIVTHDHRSLDLVHRTFEIEDGLLATDTLHSSES